MDLKWGFNRLKEGQQHKIFDTNLIIQAVSTCANLAHDKSRRTDTLEFSAMKFETSIDFLGGLILSDFRT